MSRSRFNRNYELTIKPVNMDAVIVRSPLRISFSSNKSVSGGLNRLTVRIYNLNEKNRLALAKDVEQFEKRIPLTLLVGYEGAMQSIFKGTVHRGENYREGPDLITELESLDGGFDFLNSFTARTVKGKTKAIDAILLDTPNTTKGKLTEQPKIVRPKVLVGSSLKIVDELIREDETWYIDDEKLYIVKPNEVTSTYIPVVNASTGLLNTPTREQSKVTFETLINPTLHIAGLCKLESLTAPHLNGVYKIDTMGYAGDNYGAAWTQTITGLLRSDFKTL